MKDCLGKTIEFSLGRSPERQVGTVSGYNEPGTEMHIERPEVKTPLRVACSEVTVHRILPAGTVVAPPVVAAPPVPVVRWSPVTKTVQSFEDGTVDEAQTQYVRERLGLPAWKPQMMAKDYQADKVLLTPELAAEFAKNGCFGKPAEPEKTEDAPKMETEPPAS